ncbi:unnamed protein product, partial [Ectocarpus sp. 13 AM-2016]
QQHSAPAGDSRRKPRNGCNQESIESPGLGGKDRSSGRCFSPSRVHLGVAFREGDRHVVQLLADTGGRATSMGNDDRN